jgi:hypothetical protein
MGLRRMLLQSLHWTTFSLRDPLVSCANTTTTTTTKQQQQQRQRQTTTPYSVELQKRQLDDHDACTPRAGAGEKINSWTIGGAGVRLLSPCLVIDDALSLHSLLFNTE